MRTTVYGGLLAATALLALVGPAGAAQSPAPGVERVQDVALVDPAARFVPGELLVRFRSGVAPAARSAALSQHGADRKRDLRLPGLVSARVPSGRDVGRVIEALERRADVLYAERNWIYRTAATPNDPRFGELWGLHQASDVDIDAPEAWNTTTGSSDVVVGVIDTGIAWQHPDLAANIWTNADEIAGNGVDDDDNGYVDDVRGWDFVNDDNDPYDDHAHGTHVAGTIGGVGNNAVGVAGVNWNVKLMPLKFLGANGSGTNEDAIQAILYARDNGANVVNNSWGGGGFSQALEDAFADSPTTLFLNAAGNGGSDGVGDNNDLAPTWPCNHPVDNIICVAATTSTDARASFSNFGATTVDLGAPGVGILSTVPAPPTGPSLFSEGWETEIAGRWVPGGTPNTWARTTEAKSAGTHSATDSPGVFYANNTYNWIALANPVDLSGRSGCVVEYDMRLHVDISDALLIEGSTDNSSWHNLGGWVGSTGGAFFRVNTPLGFLSGSPTAFFRFALGSNGSTVLDGAHLDQLDVRCADPTAPNYASFNGTSMATPHVAGVAALAWAADPSASVAEVRSALLNGGDAIPALEGNTVTGRRLNAAGTLALIAPPADPTLTVALSGAGSGTVTSSPAGVSCGLDCDHTFPAGAEVTLTAAAAAGSGHASWSGCDTVSGPTCTLNLNADRDVVATFDLAPTFADVPPSHPFFTHIEQMFDRGITTGCFHDPGTGERRYCPLDLVTRQEMAVFLIRALGEPLLTPPTPTFSDVPTTHPFYGHIERFFELGITTGCQPPPDRRFCPLANVTREAMAAFVVRAKGLSLLTPAVPSFVDVPATHPFYGHIERFFEQGITTGCQPPPNRAYCPTANVTREAMAAFVIRAFPAP